MANWPLVSMKKEYGGLGIPNLQDLNVCLLGSWIKRYLNSEGKMWKDIVDSKYNPSPNILCIQNNGGASTFWKGVIWASRAVKFGYRWVVGCGPKGQILGRHMVWVLSPFCAILGSILHL